MIKKYQPNIIKLAKLHIEVLESSNFFKDYEIKNIDLVEERLCDELTQKFVLGEMIDQFCFSDEEYGTILKEIITKDVFYRLKDKGIINSYSDENTEEVYFLTNKGKKYVKGK